MKKMRIRKKYKISRIIIIVISLIFFLTHAILTFYNKKVNPKIVEVAEVKLKKFTESFLSNNIGFEILNDESMQDILIVNQNIDGEILYVDYNLPKAYEVLGIVTDQINSLIRDLESGKFENITDDSLFSSEYGLVLKVPMFVASDSAFLSNLGPKVYLKINFVGAILTNIESKITDYGMNNALVELYVTIIINEELITPVTKNLNTIEYDVLVASKVINGSVPEFYGGQISSKSNILSIPIAE